MLSLFNCDNEASLTQNSEKLFKVHNLSRYDLTNVSVYLHNVGDIISGDTSSEYLVTFDGNEDPIISFKIENKAFVKYVLLDSLLNINNVYIDSVNYENNLVYSHNH